MKLATLKNGTRDGRLVVVSRDITLCADATHIARTLQAALDEWEEVAPRLRALSAQLERGALPTERFREREALAPLPRAYHWTDGSAYLNHMTLARKARGAAMPENFRSEPLMYQGGSDTFTPPRAPILVANEVWGVDFEAELAAITGDVAMGASAAQAGAAIRLMMLVNDVSLRNLIPNELAKGFGFLHSKPPTSCSPVAVTLDELGEAWRDGRVHRPMQVSLNNQPFGRAEAGADMAFDFAALVAHSARTRPLSAGAVIGSGTVSNPGADGGPGAPVAQGGMGYSCIAEARMVETLTQGAPKTPFMSFGDVVRIEMKDADGHSIFGAIEQAVTRHEPGGEESAQ